MLRNFDLVKNGVTKKQPLFLQKCSAIILILQKSVHAFKIIKIKIDCCAIVLNRHGCKETHYFSAHRSDANESELWVKNLNF